MSDTHESATDEVEFLLNSEGLPVRPQVVVHAASLEERLSELPDIPATEEDQKRGNIALYASNDAKTTKAASESNSETDPLDEPSTTFPFDRKITDYTHATKFVKKLYEGSQCWLSNTEARQDFVDEWMNNRMGNADLAEADTNEPVKQKANPNWRWAECWRAINTWETLRTLASDKPVASYLDSFGKATDSLTKAMWPQKLQDLLRSNEEAIVKSKKDWVGRPTTPATTKFNPFPGVKVVHAGASDIKYYQTGAIGPMCLEAAFILATQLAGINWKTLHARIKGKDVDAGVFWDSAILVEGKGDKLITEYRKDGITRTLGYLSRPPNTTTSGPTGSPDAGFALAFDIDPDIDGTTKDKNVFIFAGHLIDNHSRVYVKTESKLKDLQYSDSYEPGKVIPPVGPKTGDSVYFFSHAHAAVMPYKTWMGWIGQNIPANGKGEKMPKYTQIGETHLYFLPENEPSGQNLWPRAAWLKAHPN
ncbi:hypothetical protein BC835DRAFT_1091082 [Cytidiella melzeri]|nr:hypothetical protein BC835DRAFT_1091082 [Cytidiella melzeri]